ncbi:hypothetical protein MD484_g8239, partial [Candolleomyces efflorescens]
MSDLASPPAPSVTQTLPSEQVCTSGESGATANHATAVVKRGRDATGDDALRRAKRPTTRTRKRPPRDLSLLPSLPIDILFEILRHLGPEDLLRIAQVDDRFRNLLDGPDATGIWNDVRKEWENAPPPPPGFTQVRWASVLFDKSCSMCEKKYYATMFWPLRRRACKACARDRLITQSAAKKDNPDLNSAIFNFLPSVPTPWGAQKVCARDLETAHKEWTAMKSQIADETPGAREALRSWKKTKMNYLVKINEMKQGLKEWEARVTTKQERLQAEMEKARLESAKDLLLKLGYEAVDVEDAISEDSFGNRATYWSITPASA